MYLRERLFDQKHPYFIASIPAKQWLLSLLITWKVVINDETNLKPILPKQYRILAVVLDILRFKHGLDSVGILSDG